MYNDQILTNLYLYNDQFIHSGACMYILINHTQDLSSHPALLYCTYVDRAPCSYQKGVDKGGNLSTYFSFDLKSKINNVAL